MSFDDLPKRPGPIFEAAITYAATVLERSREVAEGGDIRFYPDLAFGPDYYQRVDVYAPLEAGAPLPVLLFLHGGAFIGGYKEWMGFMAPAILSTPALFVSVSYRLAPEHPFPAPVEDVAAAVHWAWRNIARYGGDPDRMFIGGHSAGGHLASLVALDQRWLAPHGLTPAVLKGVVAVSAPLDMDFDPANSENAAALKMRRTFVPDDQDVVAANPIAQVRKDAPPFFVSAGGDDLWSLAADMRRFTTALRQCGVDVLEESFEGHDHFDTSTRCVNDGHPWLGKTIEFIKSSALV
ncbi:MAG TPA: alpha/beta hydrolase fold domain-containing protein [Novosphingobium sp.]|nr:alpha/beta hydrolase fold domain-containing protein [Novosphingobium sp.]